MMTEIAAGYELLAQRDRKRLCRSPIDEIQAEIAVCWEVRPARSASEYGVSKDYAEMARAVLGYDAFAP